MTAILTFIGWHDSGKTTLAKKVVSELKILGYRVAVIKSSSETGIEFDKPGTDTCQHRDAGADSVMLVAPDQMVLLTENKGMSLTALAHRYFPDVDIIIGEGFKKELNVAKIEVFWNQDKRLRDMVDGVIAVATNLDGIVEEHVFTIDDALGIALFIEKHFLTETGGGEEIAELRVNGHRVPLKGFVQEALAGTIHGFIRSLKLAKDIDEIELRIQYHRANPD